MASAVAAAPQIHTPRRICEPPLIVPIESLDGVTQISGDCCFPGGATFECSVAGGSIEFRIMPGDFKNYAWLAFDLLVKCSHQAKHTFALEFLESSTGRCYRLTYAALPYCQARLRFDLACFDQNKLWLDREAAFLKPTSRGDRVDAALVDCIRLVIDRIGQPIAPLRWQQSPIQITADEPARVDAPLLPNGPLVDQFGQYKLHPHVPRFYSDSELKVHLRARYRATRESTPTPGRSRWGGWLEKSAEPTGYFHTYHDDTRWWLVDPDGHLFWSAGLCAANLAPSMPIPGLRPACEWLPDVAGEFADAWRGDRRSRELSINFLIANFIRAFGSEWKECWAEITANDVQALGFNTLGNWSSSLVNNLPFVIQLPTEKVDCLKIFRDFPDVFSPEFERSANQIFRPFEHLVNEPRLLGYFLQNEAHWGFGEELPAEGMLFNSGACATRARLVQFLRDRYGSERNLQHAWKTSITLTQLASQRLLEAIPPNARPDLRDFSECMADRYYEVLCKAARAVLPNHLNLGARFPGIPRDWVWLGMRHVDVFSLNYNKRHYRPELDALANRIAKPTLIGEWQFGSLESNSPGIANQNLRTERDRALAYQIYMESAAAAPSCVGAHYFRMYDNPPLGRHDGENYSIGFFDLCHRIYDSLSQAAQQTHHRIYEVASGRVQPLTPQGRDSIYLGL